ncbi:YggS family pyridoxal phosphate-dependent enzyme [Rummeliibacillus stabekisii]|uniref:Pyridoxal phosphate homeostasis protein n=1 Tax=Rummeliibacillus stabekisii TaxID=241244 RepID=A0A143HA73_9BACL|nr:YggS family pyridoxal phosphate-dependent enzyme [Rummeliibacillus stabekisii]AMW98349.1 YggS family pyridoxal phosphate enzyme [Rummeliibacillus stabekisii]
MNSIINNLHDIQKRMEDACKKAGRKLSDITIIAVTKQVSTARTKEAIEVGLTHLGENRPEGLLDKQVEIKNNATWHYIGSLQTRKVRKVINQIDYLHSLDRISLAEEIDKRADSNVNCFVQVNVSGEDSKHGLTPEEVLPFIEQLSIFPHIRIVGLMTMAPNTENEAIIRSVFKSLKNLQLEIASKGYSYAPCTELSMGMSNDYEIAIEEGATFVRIGTALVGTKEGTFNEGEG